MTINAPAAVLLLLYELVGEEQGVPAEELRGTTQNDILKEYIARGNFIYPPGPAMRLTTDLFAYCRERIPKWNTISISGYHMREKGCSAVQEVGFTLANAIAYVQAAIDAGLEVDEFGPRLAFFFNGHNNVFQEVAKFRAVRRMWARIMRERFGAQGRALAEDALPHADRRRHAGRAAAARTTSCAWRCRASPPCAAAPSRCTRTASTRRSRCRASARRGSRCAPSRSSPTSPAPTDTVDPFAGSYFVEALTDEIEARAQELIDQVEEMGGSVKCIPFIRAEVEESAWGYEERYRQKQDIVVGVNEYVTDAGRRGRDPEGRPGVGAPAGRAAREVQGGPRPGRRGRPARGAAPGLRAATRNLLRPDARRAQGARHDRRGLRRHARGVRGVLRSLRASRLAARGPIRRISMVMVPPAV